VIRAAALLVATIPALAGDRVVSVALDPDQCYQVRDLQFSREDARIYLTEGELIFSKPVEGTRIAAVFYGEGEGGDAEILLLPPNRSERASLASFAGTPNLDEHFRTAVFVFTDDTYAQLIEQMGGSQARRLPLERGEELARTWDPVVRNLTQSFQVRIIRDLLAGETRAANGFFYGGLASQKLGNFDFLYDPRASEQISMGQVVSRPNRTFFNLWARFQARSFRTRLRTPPPPDLQVSRYRIDATVNPDLSLQVTTRVTVVVSRDATRVLQFDVSPQMKILEARIGGEPAEVFQPESLRAALIHGEPNQPFLLLPSKPLEAGREYEVEIKHAGSVITDAGNSVYFVDARGSWYPNRFPQFARFDLTFRYPADLDLVATGRRIEQSVEGGRRIARYRIDTPVRLAGFNLGRYEHRSVTRGDYTVEVYANRGAESGLQTLPQITTLQLDPEGGARRWAIDLSPLAMPQPRLKPAQRLEGLALEVAGSLEFMAGHFGPPVTKTLTVAPIPGTFGQGFPGLIYLSTLSYLDPRVRPAKTRSNTAQAFFFDILHAHETAHQWWGSVVAAATPEDNWLMEALANYSALLYMETRGRTIEVARVLTEYRDHLLEKDRTGRPVESTGPIIWGSRLESSESPSAWRVITYEKGTWIMHMIRRRLGDERFFSLLARLRRQYEFRTVSTERFRALAAEALPPKSFDPQWEAFFDQWVYSTGIPSLKMTSAVRGKGPDLRVTGVLTQSDVPDDFSVWVPIEIQFGKRPPRVHWVKTATGNVPFSIPVRQAPTKVALDPHDSVLRK
jgi:hypothetical protein